MTLLAPPLLAGYWPSTLTVVIEDSVHYHQYYYDFFIMIFLLLLVVVLRIYLLIYLKFKPTLFINH